MDEKKQKKDFIEIWNLARSKDGLKEFRVLRKELNDFGFDSDILFEPFQLPLISIYSFEKGSKKPVVDPICSDANALVCGACFVKDFCDSLNGKSKDKQKKRMAFFKKAKRFFG